MSDELPQGWTHATIGDVAEGMKNGLYKPASSYADDGVACLRMYNIGEGKIIWKNIKRMKLTPQEEQEYQLVPGDLLVNRVNSRELVGKAAVVPCNIERCVFESKNIRLRLRRDLVCPEFVNYKLLLSGSQHFIHNAQQVVGMASISQPQLGAFELPLPPLAEQRRIIAKMEKLLGQVDACRERLAKIPALLKRFRQSVLAAACSGRLTEDWRAENPADQTAAEIVETIRRRRQKEARTPAQQEKVGEIYSRDEENDSETLPSGWKFIALAKICESFDYGTSTKSQSTGKVPVLRMGNIQNGKLDWNDLVYTSDEAEIDSYRLKPKTVLFNRTNSPELVGKTAIYIGQRPAIFAGYLIRVNHYPELDPEYLNFCLNTNYARNFCESVKTDGVSQSNINAKKLGTFDVPFCRLGEQREIVKRVQKLLALADQIEARFTEAKKRVDSITQSLLAKAFRGELVATEYKLAKAEGRSFESAEQLLERIKDN